MTGSNRDSRYFNTMDAGPERFRRGQPCRIGRREINDQADDGLARIVTATNAETPDFDQPCQLRRRGGHQLTAARLEVDPVVPDQDRMRNLAGACGQDEVEGEARFAGSRRATDQYRTAFDQHRGGVDAWVPRRSHGAGSRTTKRAPATVGSPSALGGPGRFSAQMRPPWASMICFEIERPRPEFCPKP